MVAKSIAKNYTNIHKPTDYWTLFCKRPHVPIIDSYWIGHRHIDNVGPVRMSGLLQTAHKHVPIYEILLVKTLTCH